MKGRKAVLVGINADYNKVLDEYKRSVADLKMIENNFETVSAEERTGNPADESGSEFFSSGWRK